MQESTNAADYRPCPYCAELVRKEAIKCRHCASDIDPKEVRSRRGGRGGWHLTLLGVLFLLVVFVAILPRIENVLQDRATQDHPLSHLFEAESDSSQIAILEEPEAVAPRSTHRRINFGEDLEIVVGKRYRGNSLDSILRDNADWAKFEDDAITVGFDGSRFLVSIEPPINEALRRPDRGETYEILAIERL